MSDNEEDRGGIPSEYKEESKKSLTGAYRAESALQYTGGSGITTKIAPLFDGPTSWLKYMEVDRRLVGPDSARRNKTIPHL